MTKQANPPIYLNKLLVQTIANLSPTFESFFDNITLMKYRINAKIHSWRKAISSYLEDYKTTLQALFIRNDW